MVPTSNVEGDVEDVDGIVSSPPTKNMRGRVKDKIEQLIASGRITGGGVQNAVPQSETATEGPESWAMVPYQPPPVPDGVSVAGGKRPFLPKPIAVRDCPPGMRIRGGRQMLAKETEKKPAPTPVVKKVEKRKVEPPAVTVLLSDSDSEGGERAAPSVHSGKKARGASSSRSAVDGKVGKSGPPPSRVVQRKKKHKSPEPGETVVKFEPTAPEFTSANPRTRVKYILKEFDNLRRLFMADEEHRVKDAGSGTRRADLKASSTLMESGARVNGVESIYGEVPGVEVGDHYYYRMELLLISLHRQVQGGIDYIPSSKSEFRNREGQNVAVAVSVIASGGYEDDKDEGDTLVYTGQGGNNYKGDRRQGEDQTLERGNLALWNNGDLKLSVRVIRGCEYKKSPIHGSPSGRIYYYDGMYDVVDSYQETGSAGFKVWKFKLVRKAGQRALSSSLVLFKGKSLPSVLKERGERIISEDLSLGKEPGFKVRVVGCADGDRVPDNFVYITSLKMSPGLPKPTPPSPCACVRECFRRNACGCVALNGEQPYNDEGCLLKAKRLVYECSPQCHCRHSGKCINRVAQKGLRYDMEVFKTAGKGWGVRSSYFIPQGSFVCEYIGEIIHETDAEKRVSNDEYMFDLKIPDSMERRFGHISGEVRKNGISANRVEDDEDDENCQKYTVDANRYGNLARFINHSCEPNLFVQCVLYDHHDHRFPHIMLFASEHISPYKELTYDYGYEVNKIKVNGKIKVKNCYCGARSCQGRLY